jgi:2-polyprenyl-3-methyl-5-hydroxy-6-metoxy-1,4-benzoquinol methylase
MLNQLLENIYDHRTSNSLSANLRAKRFELFNTLMGSIPKQQSSINILDVGGVADFWERSDLLEIDAFNIRVKTININPFYEQHGTKNSKIKTMTGDATNMHQFHEQQFDVIFSNSVIEHVGNYDDQRRMASEIMGSISLS